MTSAYGIGRVVRGALVVTVTTVGSIAAVASCGAESDSAAFGSGGDGGLGEDGGDADAGAFNDGGGGDAGGGVPGTILMLHASPDLFDFRVCFGSSSTADAQTVTFADVPPWPWDDSHPMPMSNYAAVGVGGGVGVPRAILSPGTFVIPYLVSASRIATDGKPLTSCAERVGPVCSGAHCLTSSSDVVQLPALLALTLSQPVIANVLAVVGCKSATGAACGSEMSGALHGAIVPLNGFVQQGVDQIGALLAHVAPAAGSVVATFDDTFNDAGPVALDYLHFGPPSGVIVNRPSDPGSALWGTEGITIGAAIDGGASLRMSLADIQRVTDPSVLPSDFFASGGRYVFVLVGDPNAANALYADGGINPKYDGTALHVVAISTDAPPAPSLDGGH